MCPMAAKLQVASHPPNEYREPFQKRSRFAAANRSFGTRELQAVGFPRLQAHRVRATMVVKRSVQQIRNGHWSSFLRAASFASECRRRESCIRMR